MTLIADPTLVLRDIHQPPAPPWWPPAPGWWVLVAIALLAALVAAWFAWRRSHRRRAFAGLFDHAMREAPTPAARVAAMSELLRRAGRHRDPRADTMQGDDWLRFLDAGSPQPLFAGECGRLLLDGGFRADADEAAVAMLVPRARRRFLEWMDRR
jgi:hypothetical protein